MSFFKKLNDPAAHERLGGAVVALMRMVVGWHLAYMGVWALTSTWDYSWAGCFRCAHWLFGGTLRGIGGSAAMGGVDMFITWALLAAGALLMLGVFVRPAAALGIAYLALIYLLNPPHFGHTGESHFMYVDRNVVEIMMLLCVMAWRRGCADKGEGEKGKAEEDKEAAK